jgi:hypothetical protein
MTSCGIHPQVRAAQEGTRVLEDKIRELESALDQSKKDNLAYKQELRRTKKQLEDEAARPRPQEQLAGTGGAGGAGDEALRKQVTDMTVRMRGFQSELESARGAAGVVERRLALAEERARIAEEFAHAQGDMVAKLQSQVSASRRNSAASPPTLGASPSEATLKTIAESIESAIAQGAQLWKANKKGDCFTLYKTTTERAVRTLPPGPLKDKLQEALQAATKQGNPNGAVALRKAFDVYLADSRRSPTPVPDPEGAPLEISVSGAGVLQADAAMQDLQRKLEELKRQSSALPTTALSPTGMGLAPSPTWGGGGGGGDGVDAQALTEAITRARIAEARVEELERQLEERGEDPSGGDGDEEPDDSGAAEDKPTETPSSRGGAKAVAPTAGGAGAGAGAGGGAASAQVQQKLKNLEKKAKEDAVKIRKLEEQLAKAQSAPGGGGGGGAGDGISQKQLERELANQEKRLKKTYDDDMKKKDRELAGVQSSLRQATKSVEDLTAELAGVKEEKDRYKRQAADLGSVTQELEQLRARAAEAAAMEATIKEQAGRMATLEEQYKNEQVGGGGRLREDANGRAAARL